MSTINNRFYKKSYENYGISAKGLHWSSKETQYKRFEIIVNLLKKEILDSSIIDIGSGFGDFLNYLDENFIKLNSYIGVDCEDFILDIARKRFPLNFFLKCDILKNEIPNADYLICSGALNIFKTQDIFIAIDNCFKASDKGFIFNFLTKDSIHNLREEQIYNFCKTLTSEVTIINSYLENDSTIYLKK